MSAQSDLPDNVPGFNQQPEPVGNSAAPGDTYNLTGDFRGAKVYIKSTIQLDAHWVINREYMLKRVRKDWLEGVLEPAKAIHPLIDLGMKHHARSVQSPWDDVIQRRENTVSKSSTSNKILDVFDSANGTLLILGEPGAGKTISLLRLANELILRAETGPEHPIPVVLNLSSWDEQQASFEDWLVEELRGKYFVPRPVAQDYIAKDSLTLLLDGLDEVPDEKRPACIEAINYYRQGHGPAQIVVCSRRADYENQPQRLQLDDAILLQPLGQHQIDQFLAENNQGKDVARVIHQDTTLGQFARTPLMLNIMLLASKEISAQDWSHLGSAEAHRERIFDVYLKHAFGRRGLSHTQKKESTLRVLPWLARNMSQQGQTVFLMEGLSADWLKTKRQRLGFTIGIHFLIASIVALIISLVYIFSGAPEQYVPKMALAIGIATLVTGIASARLNKPSTLLLNMGLTSLTCSWALGEIQAGLIAGFILGIPGGATAIAFKNPRMTDRLHWSWRRTVLVLSTVILVELFAGLFIYRTAGMESLSMIATLLPLAALPIGVGITLAFGWRPSLRVASTVRPNQGFSQSLRNATGITLFLSLVLMPLSLPAGLSHNLNNQQNIWEPSGLLLSLLFVLSTVWLIALPIGLAVGGAACLQQLVLRSILAKVEKLPWNLVNILDNATDRIILQRVGGGYIFQHRLLQDYFAKPKFNQTEKEKEQP